MIVGRDNNSIADAHRLIVAEIPRLRRYARFHMHSMSLADDMVQECLIRAVSKLDTWQVGTNMRAWLFTILHNVCINHWRREKLRGETVEMPEDGVASAILNPQEQHIETVEVQKAFNLLAPDHRQVLLLAAVEGLSYEETAELLGVPTGTVRSRVFRARAALQELLLSGKARAAAVSRGRDPAHPNYGRTCAVMALPVA